MRGLTPMLRQYVDAKAQHPDALLFFRAGDFYELFFEDAKEASRRLDIALTARGKAKGEPVPMAGVPHHAVDGYITRLLEQGVKVAVCEQLEDARFAKGIVKRGITRVVTPGVALEDANLDARSHNFLLAITRLRHKYGLAYVDASTGDFYVSEFKDAARAKDEVARIDPREVLIPRRLALDEKVLTVAQSSGVKAEARDDSPFEVDVATELLGDHFEISSLDGFGLKGYGPAIGAAGAVLTYLKATRLGHMPLIDRLTPYQSSGFLVLDETSRRNLELFSTLQDGKKAGSLLHHLDLTQTSMGGRLLRRWLAYPLMNVADIHARQEAVGVFVQRGSLRDAMREELRQVADIERLNARITAKSAHARDLAALRRSLDRIPSLLELLAQVDAPSLARFVEMDRCEEVAQDIAHTLVEEPPIGLKDGGLIRYGINDTLDELVDITREGKGVLAKLEAREREKTGIHSLKIKYNRVFGYFIEVTKTKLDGVPDHYVRKQTLVNAERFITPELKEWEAKILGADERRHDLEYALFVELRDRVSAFGERLKALGRQLAELDCLIALGEVAVRYDYSRPDITDNGIIEITQGRHPVVERHMARGERFVPNDVYLDPQSSQVLILTGPNMAGKSTVMRQVALIVLMAQLGSFVPAQGAKIGVVDRIFTRVGASDNLARGHSTFMVEMTETANILHHATQNSLVVLDEIGRGTSTYDGVSIAWAVTETLHDKIGAKTMFATHYHELVALESLKERVQNFNVSVSEWGERIVFLRTLKRGGASRSYGIQVARLAGLPQDVIERSHGILAKLERGELVADGIEETGAKADGHGATGPGAGGDKAQDRATSQVMQSLKDLDINAMTPLDALTTLHRLQTLMKEA